MRNILPTCEYNLHVLPFLFVPRADKYKNIFPAYLVLDFQTIQGTVNSIPFYIEIRHFGYYFYTNFGLGVPMAVQYTETYRASEVSDRRWDSDDVIKYYACKLFDQFKKDQELDSLDVKCIDPDFPEESIKC